MDIWSSILLLSFNLLLRENLNFQKQKIKERDRKNVWLSDEYKQIFVILIG